MSISEDVETMLCKNLEISSDHSPEYIMLAARNKIERLQSELAAEKEKISNQCTSTTQREDFYHNTITLQCEQSSGHQGLHHAAVGAWNTFWKDNNGKDQDQTKNSLLNN